MNTNRPTYVIDPADIAQSQEQGADIATAWLKAQPGDPLLLLHAKKALDNNKFLKHGARGVRVEGATTLANSGWRGGPLLVAWPSNEVVGHVQDRSRQITALCILLSYVTNNEIKGWLREIGAINLLTDEPWGDAADEHGLAPILIAAMEDVGRMVNHNNALVQDYDKAIAVETLQTLYDAGYRWDTQQLCGWAGANGFGSREIKNLRDYSNRVLQGRSFRLRESAGIGATQLERWRSAAGK